MPIDRFQRNHGQFGEKSRFSLYEVWAISIERLDRKFANYRNIETRFIGALSYGVTHPTNKALFDHLDRHSLLLTDFT